MKYIYIFGVLILTVSCQFFETEKVASEVIFEEEMKSIDWKRVDQYPAVINCEKELKKEAQKQCFINALSETLYKTLQKKNMKAVRAMNDTIIVDFSIQKDAHLLVTQIKMDSSLQRSFPLLQQWLQEGIQELDVVAPAFKRGIPVETSFSLPVVVKTSD